MPALAGFSDNPFVTHSDCVRAAHALLSPLKPYTSPNGARIRLPVATGTHFDEIAAQLEGYARPLWAVGALLSLSGNSKHESAKHTDKYLDSWIEGLKAGTDPSQKGGRDGEYWGTFQTTNQRMVELEIVSYALLAAPDSFLPPAPKTETDLTPDDHENMTTRKNIIAYLRSINGKEMPVNNWRWFRIITNLALIKSFGVPYVELREAMDADHAILESFYLNEGWSADGVWSDEGRQADYYSGSFAIQFSQLLYCRYAADIDPERCAVFQERARKFALQFWRYFDTNGAAIPFGRSLTYRFAQSGFWAALVVSGVPLPDDLPMGAVKGLLLRNLRYWASKPDIFNIDGTMNIGYIYPNMYMCEDYNSPQSVYWCLKTLIAISLPEDHEFWACKELPHPQNGIISIEGTQEVHSIAALDAPKQIVISSLNHHYLLSLGQFCPWPIKATSAKYCKFAYSSLFGFSVPTGPLLPQLAPDNTLLISEDEGDTWKTIWKSCDLQLGARATLGVESNGKLQYTPLHTLSATWSPGAKSSITVQTTLIPPTKRWPDWHVRVHRIRKRSRTIAPKDDQNSEAEVLTVEGGFAISGERDDGLPLQMIDRTAFETSNGLIEGKLEEKLGALVFSSEGVSGIAKLNISSGETVDGGTSDGDNVGVVLKPDSNTNLIYQRSLIPTLQRSIRLKGQDEVVLIAGVFARKGASRVSGDELQKFWDDRPVIMDSKQMGGRVEGSYIQI